MSNTFRTSTYVTGVPCSFCGAQPNHWCKNLNGTRRQIGPHRARGWSCTDSPSSFKPAS